MDGIGVELSSAAKELYKVLKQAMKSTCLVHDFLFQERLEAMEQSGEDIFGGVSGVIYNQPYNTLWIAEPSNSEHNRIILQYLSHVMEFLSTFMDVVADGDRFCFALQSKTWYGTLVGKVEYFSNEENVVKGKEVQSQRTTVL